MSVEKIRDPLSELLYSRNDYVRKIFSEKDLVLTRLECSFYHGDLKTIE